MAKKIAIKQSDAKILFEKAELLIYRLRIGLSIDEVETIGFDAELISLENIVDFIKVKLEQNDIQK